MLLEDICPFVRQAIIANLTSNTKYDVYHKLKAIDCRLFYVISGYGNIIIDGTSYQLRPKTCVIFKSGIEYEWQVDELKTYTLNFDYTFLHSELSKSVHPIHSELFDENKIIENIVFEDSEELNYPLVIHDGQVLEPMIRTLNTEKYISGDFSSLYTSSLLKAIIIGAVRLYREQHSPKEGKNAALVREIIEYIESNFNVDITNSDISSHFNYNSSYLNRVFKQHVGMTLHSFLLTFRINTAMEMLDNQSSSVGEIAESVGFTDIPHFVKSFKKITGKTPGEYRKEALLK